MPFIGGFRNCTQHVMSMCPSIRIIRIREICCACMCIERHAQHVPLRYMCASHACIYIYGHSQHVHDDTIDDASHTTRIFLRVGTCIPVFSQYFDPHVYGHSRCMSIADSSSTRHAYTYCTTLLSRARCEQTQRTPAVHVTRTLMLRTAASCAYAY